MPMTEIVEHGHRMPGLYEMSRDGAADISGAAHHQNVGHAALSDGATTLTPSPGEQTKISGVRFVAAV